MKELNPLIYLPLKTTFLGNRVGGKSADKQIKACF